METGSSTGTTENTDSSVTNRSSSTLESSVSDDSTPSKVQPAAATEKATDLNVPNGEEKPAEITTKANSTGDEKRLQGDIWRLSRLREAFKLGSNYTSARPCKDVDSARVLVQNLKAIQWVIEEIEQTGKARNEDEEKKEEKKSDKRVRASPEIKHVPLDTWCQESRDRSLNEHAALYILTEEPPSPEEPLQWNRTPGVTIDTQGADRCLEHGLQSTGRPQVRPLPPRIRIASRAASRILNRICSRKLNSRYDGLVLLRPFRILVYMDREIRQQLDVLRQACREPAATTDARSVTHTRFDSAYSTEEIFDSSTDWTRLTLEEKEEAAADFALVVSFMDQHIKPLAQLRAHGDNHVYFNELWHILHPGTLVYAKDAAVPQKVWKVLQGTGGRKLMSIPVREDKLQLGDDLPRTLSPFRLVCFYIDFNGSSFVPVYRTFAIEKWEGLQRLEELPVIPLEVAEQGALINRTDLIERGKEFVRYTKQSYSYYRGRSLCNSPSGDPVRRPQRGSIGSSIAVLSETIEGAVVVDFKRCLQAIPDWIPMARDEEISKPPNGEVEGDRFNPRIEDDRVWDMRIAETILDFKDPAHRLDKHKPLEGEDLLLLPDRVFAFILRTRQWACLQLGPDEMDKARMKLTSMNRNPDAWEGLQLDRNHRHVIEALMNSHFSKTKWERRQLDLIRDKGCFYVFHVGRSDSVRLDTKRGTGNGLIILLHGPPGVGKTSTAEAVAEYYNKPLLPITCGDLGLTPAEVETNLQTSFQRGQGWECVLLLDEADVFLAEREPNNVERNALVSVFLRNLEYYEGILFLTTNKIGTFDEAFKSRVSTALYYPPLSQMQTMAIWKGQMDRTKNNSQKTASHNSSQHVDFEERDIMSYAEELFYQQQNNPQYQPIWNGRQIRNAFQAAVALAEFERKGEAIMVERSHFAMVAKVANAFNSYMCEVKKGRTDAAMNEKRGRRVDGHVPISSQAVPPHGTGAGQGGPYVPAGQLRGQQWNNAAPPQTSNQMYQQPNQGLAMPAMQAPQQQQQQQQFQGVPYGLQDYRMHGQPSTVAGNPQQPPFQVLQDRMPQSQQVLPLTPPDIHQTVPQGATQHWQQGSYGVR